MHARCGRWLVPGLGALIAGCVCGLSASGALASTESVHAGTFAKSRPAKHHKRKPHFADPLTTPAMRAYLGARTGDITVGVENVLTDRTYLWNGRSEQVTASIIKVNILETLLHELHGAPIPGADVSTAIGMIENSDNHDANALWNLDGGAPALASYDRLVGMDQTTPSLYWGLTTTTAGDQLKLVDELVEPHALINPGAQAFALGLMGHVTPAQAWGVSGGVPPGVSVALKNGWLPFGGGWHVNSIGRIRGDRRWYLIAVLTSFDPSEAYGIATINGVSSRVWHALAPPPRRPLRGRLGPGERGVGRPTTPVRRH